MEQVNGSLGNDKFGATQISEFVPETPQPGFIEKSKVAFEEVTIGGAAIRALSGATYEKDENFWKTDTEVKNVKYLNGLSEESQIYVSNARSDEEAVARRTEAMGWDNNQKIMEEAGMTGMFLPTIAAALLDPATYAFGIGEFKAMGSLAKMSLGGRTAAGAASGAVYEIPQVATNIHADSSNILIGAAFGGVITPVVSHFVDGKAMPAPTREDIVKELTDRPDAITKFEQTTSVGAKQVDNTQIERAIENESEEELLTSLANQETALDEGHVAPDQNVVTDLANNFMDKIDVSLTGTFKRSADKGNGVSSWVSKAILSDASGKNTRGTSAAAEKHALDVRFTEIVGDLDDISDRYFRETYNTSKLQQNAQSTYKLASDEFHKKVYDHMSARNQKHTSTDYADWVAKETEASPRVVEAANALDKHYKMVLGERKKAGEVGFKNTDHAPGYLPRILDQDSVVGSRQNSHLYYKLFGEELERLGSINHNRAIDKLELDNTNIKQQLRESVDTEASAKLTQKIQENSAKISAKRAEIGTPEFKAKYAKAGKSFYDNLVRSGLGFQTSIDDLVNTTDIGKLTDLLGDAKAAREMYDSLQAVKAEESKSARAKYRIDFDMNKSTVDANGAPIKLSDLYTTNISHLSSRYGREASGRVALANKGIKSEDAWRQVAKLGGLQESKGQGPELTQKMEDIFNMMLSRPIEGAMGKGTRRINEFVNLTMLGKTGIAQLADTAMIAANHGMVNTVKAMKEFQTMSKLIKEGKADETMLGQLSTLSGRIGQDHILFNPTLDRIGENLDNVSNPFWNKYDEVTGLLSKNLYYMNGMNHVKAYQQKVSTISGVYNVVDIVGKGKDRARLLSMGFNNKTLNALQKEIDNGTVVMDKNGGVSDLQLSKWGRVKDAQDFAVQMRTSTTHSVQEPLIGEGVLAMQKDVGALMLKLMSFPLLAMQKQVSRTIYHHDMTSVALFTYGTMAGMSVYSLNQVANSIGNEQKDIDEIFDDPYKVFMGGAMYNPLSGILPDFANGMAALGLLPQEFSPSGSLRGREGLTNGPSIENIADMTPVTKAVLAPMRAISLVPRALSEGGFPDRGAYDMQAALPLGNTIFFGPFFNLFKD